MASDALTTPTAAEVLIESYVCELFDRRTLAFVWDAAIDEVLVAIESPRGRALPFLPYSPAQGLVREGGETFFQSAQVPRRLAAWLTECRDSGADLTIGPQDLSRWWDHGVQRLRAEDVVAWLG